MILVYDKKPSSALTRTTDDAMDDECQLGTRTNSKRPAFFDVIRMYGPHVYHSGLPLSTKRRSFATCANNMLVGWKGQFEGCLSRGNQLLRPRASKTCSERPYGHQLQSVYILDAVTLSRLSVLECFPIGTTRRLSFSPDSLLIRVF